MDLNDTYFARLFKMTKDVSRDLLWEVLLNQLQKTKPPCTMIELVQEASNCSHKELQKLYKKLLSSWEDMDTTTPVHTDFDIGSLYVLLSLIWEKQKKKQDSHYRASAKFLRDKRNELAHLRSEMTAEIYKIEYNQIRRHVDNLERSICSKNETKYFPRTWKRYLYMIDRIHQDNLGPELIRALVKEFEKELSRAQYAKDDDSSGNETEENLETNSEHTQCINYESGFVQSTSFNKQSADQTCHKLEEIFKVELKVAHERLEDLQPKIILHPELCTVQRSSYLKVERGVLNCTEERERHLQQWTEEDRRANDVKALISSGDSEENEPVDSGKNNVSLTLTKPITDSVPQPLKAGVSNVILTPNDISSSNNLEQRLDNPDDVSFFEKEKDPFHRLERATLNDLDSTTTVSKTTKEDIYKNVISVNKDKGEQISNGRVRIRKYDNDRKSIYEKVELLHEPSSQSQDNQNEAPKQINFSKLLPAPDRKHLSSRQNALPPFGNSSSGNSIAEDVFGPFYLNEKQCASPVCESPTPDYKHLNIQKNVGNIGYIKDESTEAQPTVKKGPPVPPKPKRVHDTPDPKPKPKHNYVNVAPKPPGSVVNTATKSVKGTPEISTRTANSSQQDKTTIKIDIMKPEGIQVKTIHDSNQADHLTSKENQREDVQFETHEEKSIQDKEKCGKQKGTIVNENDTIVIEFPLPEGTPLKQKGQNTHHTTQEEYMTSRESRC